jgi:hypothetical protein
MPVRLREEVQALLRWADDKLNPCGGFPFRKIIFVIIC